MNVQATYVRTDEGKVEVVLRFTKNRDDDPEVWYILPRRAWDTVTCPSLRGELNSVVSEPFATIEEAQEWERKQLNEIKEKITAYRMSKRHRWISGTLYEEETRNMMDTVVRVTVYATDKASADKAAAAAFARIQKVADAASIFDKKAEAFRLNRDGHLDNPSAELIELTRLSLEYNRITNGYFDITVQPLLDLWSAGLWKEKPEVQQSRVAETMKLIGSDNIELSASRISLPVKGMKLTFGAIAKGYAVEEALNTLKAEGIKHATVTAGGEIGSLGTKPDGQPWTIALVNPDNAKQSLATFQWLAEKSISTSGNYERYFSADKKVNHLVNPKTGYSIPDCTSVTIIASTNTRTDALATAIFAMGPEAGMNLVKSLKDVECLMVDGNNQIITSRGIDKYLSQS